MIKKISLLFTLAVALVCSTAVAAPQGRKTADTLMQSEITEPETTTLSEADKKEAADDEEKEELDVKEVIFHHLGDGYGWEVPFSHVYRIPLPVIVRAQDGQWFSFSSGKLTEVEVTEDIVSGKKSEELIPVIHNVERNGKTYSFVLAHISEHKNKLVQIFPLSAAEQEEVTAEAMKIAKEKNINPSHAVVPGYVNVDGHYYREYRPFDISITKNVLALLISAAILTALVMWLVRYYRRKDMKAPRKGLGFFEMLISFVYDGVIRPTLKERAPKYGPYLLTCFFFILIMNLLGLIVIFPGGANLTGNIAVTLVLAVLTFLVTNIKGNKHYWKEIFWPDVPMFLKCPLPIMQVIEIFGIFTKPAALCVRLFANMMGGHMIVITLTLLIFIFASFGAAVAGGTAVVSVLFSLFMLLLDVLVSFIQAYVFTTLSTMFISMSTETHHEHDAEHVEKEISLDNSSKPLTE